MIKLAVLLTVYNRKTKTLNCLESLYSQNSLPYNLQLEVIMVDDGCTDGTPDAVQARFPKVRILMGDGNLFWCRGMHLAFGTALSEGYDFYLWLNDDVVLFPNAINRLLNTSKGFNHQSIIIGAMQDPETGQLTYGGVKRLHWWAPLRFTQVEPSDYPIEVETMNGNCVLIPSSVAKKIGNLDPTFKHGMGDFDYGLRARKLGVQIYLAPGYFGTCLRNLPPTQDISIKRRLQYLLSPHGLPPREWAVFAQRYAGMLWFLYWLSPYLKNLLVYGISEIRRMVSYCRNSQKFLIF